MKFLRNLKKLNINQFEIWIADLNPRFGTEPGKKRPILVVQTDLINKIHPSSLICPITTKVIPKSNILRVHLKKKEGNVKSNCDIMIDQIRAIDNSRLIKKVGKIPVNKIEKVKENIKIIFDL